MKFKLFILSTEILILCSLLQSCSQNAKKKAELKWSKDLPVIGSQSSPRATDLNGDGVLDIVMGAGKNEFQESDMGILAFDGKTGNVLWKQHSKDQVYGTPALLDINSDKTEDIFIGGRSPQLKALDGKTGKVIWEFDPLQYQKDPVMKFARYNFNNCVLVPDQNNDGLQDVLTINGGNALAAPYSTENRFPAVMMLLDSKTGKVISADTMPDGKESYITPVIFSQPGSKETYIVFGTGGETIDGNLYKISLADFLAHKISASKILASDKGHGFIAPPTLADINGDGLLDIVAITHGSKVVAIDGKDDHLIWSKIFPGTECSNSFAAGYFTGDKVPDFFTFISKGVWPNSAGSVQVMIDGKDGNVVYMDSMGCTGFSSPVVYDLNDDGFDEAIISINEYDCSLGYASKSPGTVENKVLAIDFKKRAVNTIDQARGFKNVFTTPWIGDLDGDGYLDLVHCQYYHYSNLLSFLGMRVKRIDLPVKIDQPVAWGAYLGTHANAVFAGRE